ncbi:MAG TPA: hypothetical protein VMB21_04105 [Candidatus Limnocylindria bacterium]|nr:hypothetical protein [Candidatus Limnocylindria bacterium]
MRSIWGGAQLAPAEFCVFLEVSRFEGALYCHLLAFNPVLLCLVVLAQLEFQTNGLCGWSSPCAVFPRSSSLRYLVLDVRWLEFRAPNIMMTDLREFLRIMALCVVSAISYGIVHDQFTAHLCIEYFTVAHPPVFTTTSPWLLGLGWGVIATWWVGGILGVMLALSACGGSWSKVKAGELVKPVLILMAATALAALVCGATGYLLFKAHRIGIAGWEEDIPVEKQAAFSADMWSHLASYAAGLLGGITLSIRTLWIRWRTSRTNRQGRVSTS